MSAPAERDRTLLYRIGGIVAFVALGGMVFDIVLSMLPGWGLETVPVDAAAWLAQLSTQPLLGVRNLDLLNVSISVLSLPPYLALLDALRPSAPGLAMLGVGFVAVGTAVFVASNAALPMLALAGHWSGAAAPARPALEAAAEALLARGAHGSAGAFPGFFLSTAGTLIITLGMLRQAALSRRTGIIGAVGAGLLLVYTVVYTFSAGDAAVVMALAMPGGLLIIAWYALAGGRLLALAREANGAGTGGWPTRHAGYDADGVTGDPPLRRLDACGGRARRGRA